MGNKNSQNKNAKNNAKKQMVESNLVVAQPCNEENVMTFVDEPVDYECDQS